MIRRVLLYIIKLPIWLYQKLISPLFPRTCRHYPSCSHYTKEAINIHGPIYGGWLAIKRIASCHPFNEKWNDPVPPKESKNDQEVKVTKQATKTN